jgi:hypothetical protein
MNVRIDEIASGLASAIGRVSDLAERRNVDELSESLRRAAP